VRCGTLVPWLVLPCVQLAPHLIGIRRLLGIAADGFAPRGLQAQRRSANVAMAVAAPFLLALSPRRHRHVPAQMVGASALVLGARELLRNTGARHTGDDPDLLLVQAVALLAVAVWHVVAAAAAPLSWGVRGASRSVVQPPPLLLLCSAALPVAALCAHDTISFMWIISMVQFAPLWCALPPPWRVRVCLMSLFFCGVTMFATVQLCQLLPVPRGRLGPCDHVPAHTPLVLYSGENKTKEWLSQRSGDFVGRQPVLFLNREIWDVCFSMINVFRDPARKAADPSTGCTAVFLAAQVCNSVSLYGFGPDSKVDAKAKGLSGLYSATSSPRWHDFHDFSAEHALYRGFIEAQTAGTEFWQNRMRELNHSARILIQERWRVAMPWLTTALHCVRIKYPGHGVSTQQVPGVCGKEVPGLRITAASVSDCIALGRLSLSPFVASLTIAAKKVTCELFATCRCAEGGSCPSAREREIGWKISRTGVASKQRDEANASECWEKGREHTLLNSFGPGDASVLMGPSGRHDTCALVGSGTELKHQGLGTTIDAHDQVWRLNHVPEVMLSSRAWRNSRADSLRRDVGERTDVVVANHHAWKHC